MSERGSYRGGGRGRGRGGHGGRGRGRSYGGKSASQKSTTASGKSERKVLSDYVYYIGSAKQASDYPVITSFIINHIQKTFTNGDDIADALETKNETVIQRPSMQISQRTSTAPQSDIVARELQQQQIHKENRELEILYQAQITVYMKRSNTYDSNKGRAFALIYGQCNKAMQSKHLP